MPCILLYNKGGVGPEGTQITKVCTNVHTCMYICHCILAKVSQVSVQTFEDWALEHIANGVCHQAIVEGPLTEWCEHNNVHLRSSFDHLHVKGTK